MVQRTDDKLFVLPTTDNRLLTKVGIVTKYYVRLGYTVDINIDTVVRIFQSSVYLHVIKNM